MKGNMQNMSSPDKMVLGYFYAASESNRRYFFKDVEGIELNFDNGCREEGLGRGGWREFTRNDYPVYYTVKAGSVRILSLECIDCRKMGGTTVKPDFWPR